MSKVQFRGKSYSGRNGESVNILFIISITITVQCYTFEIYIFVSEIYDDADLVLGGKNLVELEGEISMID